MRDKSREREGDKAMYIMRSGTGSRKINIFKKIYIGNFIIEKSIKRESGREGQPGAKTLR